MCARSSVLAPLVTAREELQRAGFNVNRPLTDVKNRLHKGVNAVECPCFAVVGCNPLVKKIADVLGLVLEDRFHFSNVAQCKGVCQQFAMILVFSTLHENQTMTGHLFGEATEPFWL